MRIRTQFMMTMLLFAIILVVISTSVIVTNRQVEKTSRQQKIANDIAQGASELSYLTNDYLMYRESLQLTRWQSRFTSFSTQVASLQANGLEQQALVNKIQANTFRLKEVFDSITASFGNSSHNQSVALDPALLQVSWSRMAVQSQGLVSDASRLAQMLHDQVDRLQQTSTIVILLLVAVSIASFFADYALLLWRTLKSIAVLQAGAAVIGSGNLDFKIKEKKNDEVGELSHAFNRMTVNLKDATASKADLEREIVERKKAEAALRKSEEKYRNLFSTMSEGFGLHEILLDADGKPCDYRFLELNDAFENLTGLSRENAIGKTVKQILPNVESYWIETYGRVALTGEPAHFDNYAAPLGRWFGTYAYSPAKNQFAVLFGDITERKQAEEKLIVSETRYRRLFESAKDGILILDGDTGRVVDVNPFLLNLLGYSSDEFLGKELWEIGLFKDIASSREAFVVLQNKGYIRYEDLPLETSDGRRIEVEFVSNVYLVNHTKVIQCNVSCVFRSKLAGVTEENGHPVDGKWPPSRSKLASVMKALLKVSSLPEG